MMCTGHGDGDACTCLYRRSCAVWRHLGYDGTYRLRFHRFDQNGWHITMTTEDDRWDLDCYKRWQRGLCVCCGESLDWYYAPGEGGERRSIGEGVEICGYCVCRGHDEDDVAPHLLAGLIRGRELAAKRPAPPL